MAGSDKNGELLIHRCLLAGDWGLELTRSDCLSAMGRRMGMCQRDCRIVSSAGR